MYTANPVRNDRATEHKALIQTSIVCHMLDQKANLEEAAYRNDKDTFTNLLYSIFDTNADPDSGKLTTTSLILPL